MITDDTMTFIRKQEYKFINYFFSNRRLTGVGLRELIDMDLTAL